MRKKSSFNITEYEEAKNNWEGKIFTNSYGTKFKVIKYIDHYKVKVKFMDSYGYEYIANKNSVLKGSVRNPYDKTVFGITCIGNTKTVIPNARKLGLKNSKSQKISYSKWVSMLERCYIKVPPTYKDCTVCEQWFCYENFESWFDENYYSIPGCRMDLDKDILVKGNKVYSPETCVIVPSEINVLFIRGESKRNLSLGVVFTENKKRYESYVYRYVNGVHKRLNLGRYDSVEEAFSKYKEAKETYIKEVADKYKKYIPKKLYDKMYEYKVESSD